MDIDLNYIESIETIKHPTIVTEQVHYHPSLFSSGSGSTITLFDSGATGSKINIVELNRKSNLENHINLICDTFEITDEEFAQLCSSTRKSVHNWKKNITKIQKNKSEKIFDLLIAAKNWNDMGFKISKKETHNKVVAGKSVFDILMEKPINMDILIIAGQRLQFSNEAHVIPGI